MATRGSIDQIAFRYRPADSTTGVTRNTAGHKAFKTANRCGSAAAKKRGREEMDKADLIAIAEIHLMAGGSALAGRSWSPVAAPRSMRNIQKIGPGVSIVGRCSINAP